MTPEIAVAITPSTASNEQATPTLDVVALIPNISLVLRKQPFTEAERIVSVRYPDKLAIIQINSDLWIEVQSPSGETGWLYGRFALYEGDKSQVPEGLRYQFINGRDDLPYVFGQVMTLDNNREIYILADPSADPSAETNKLKELSTGTQVTLMLKSRGSNTFGSGVWYYVMYVDVDANSLIWGFLPEEFLEPASVQ